MAELIIGLGRPRKSLASDIAKSIPSPSKLRKQQAMESVDESDDGGGDSAAESAFDVFSEAVKRGDSKAGVKAFKLMSKLCFDEYEANEDDEDDDEQDED
jgi:NAD(P)H-dependent flavin oxidoreductase YrpB (nitropropane dioxygenase family)